MDESDRRKRAGEVLRNDELLKELCGRRNGEFGDGLPVLVPLHAEVIVDERVRLRREFSREIHSVKTCHLAIEYHIAPLFVRNAAKAPEEIQMPESAVVFAIGNDVIAKLFLFIGQLAYKLVACAI